MSPAASYDSRTAVRAILLGSMVVMLAVGIRASFGLFMQPMGVDQGWGREAFSTAFALQNLIWGVSAIGMGAIADRWGAGRAIGLSLLLYAAGLIGMRFSASEFELYLSAGVLVGLGQGGATFGVILPVVARAVPPASRSTAMGIVSAGGSLGQFVLVPSGQWLMQAFDWHGTLWVLSALLAAALPLAYGLRGRAVGHAALGGQSSLSLAIREAVADRSYHFLFWSYFVCGFQTAFMLLHLPAYATDGGLTPTNGAIAVALIGLFNVIGSFWAGKLGGKISKKRLLAGIYWARSLGVIGFLAMPLTPWTLYVFAAVMGLFWLGTVPLTQGLIGQIYGLRFAATLSGMVFLGHQVGSSLGVWLGGRMYALTGSYDLVWWLSIGLGIMAGLLCLPINESAKLRPAAA
ncbi:MAG: MFS transporter [Pigmentiphaga sp.]|nr:MFS transporter [Pigmentiphaga sp.]